jgi:hypothetical protein
MVGSNSTHGIDEYLLFSFFVLSCVCRGLEMGQFFLQEITPDIYKGINKLEPGRNWTAAAYSTT